MNYTDNEGKEWWEKQDFATQFIFTSTTMIKCNLT